MSKLPNNYKINLIEDPEINEYDFLAVYNIDKDNKKGIQIKYLVTPNIKLVDKKINRVLISVTDVENNQTETNPSLGKK